MKKALAILMILALVGSAAFAEITFGAWGRGVFVPVMNSGASGVDSTSADAASWGADLIRVGFTVSGVSDNVGFQVDVTGENVGTGDQQKIWVKPFNGVTVTVGNYFDDTLRGNAAFGSFNWYRPYGTWTGEDVIFDRIYSEGQGFEVALAPVEGLYIAASFKGVDGLTEALATNGQYAFGYTIAGIGQIRAQYIGDYIAETAESTTYSLDSATGELVETTTLATKKDNDATVEVAFKVTAVENLYADIGVKMFTNNDFHAQETKTISAYANYKVSAATIHFLAIYDLNKDDDGYNIGAGVDYSLAGGLGISADVRYTNDIKNGGTDALTTAFAGVTKGFSNGKIGAGVEISAAADTGYAIPVICEYWF